MSEGGLGETEAAVELAGAVGSPGWYPQALWGGVGVSQAVGRGQATVGTVPGQQAVLQVNGGSPNGLVRLHHVPVQ